MLCAQGTFSIRYFSKMVPNTKIILPSDIPIKFKEAVKYNWYTQYVLFLCSLPNYCDLGYISYERKSGFHWCSPEHWPLARCGKLKVVHAPGMPGTFSSPPTSKETARVVMHVRIANPRWQGNRSRQSRRMRNPQFYVSVKRPVAA